MEIHTRSFSAFDNSSILVTGGCGFIGSHLVKELKSQGAIITVFDNLQAGHWSNLGDIGQNVQMIEGDVRDEVTVRHLVDQVKPGYVFHMAANASVPGSVADPVYDFETNCAGTFVLLNSLRLWGGCNKVVLASSGAVYGEPSSFPIRENDPIKPISPYGASKANSELTAKVFGTVYSLPIVVARIFNTYGPRMARFVILDFLRKLQQDPTKLEVLGNGQQVRDFTYASDTVQALLLLAAHGIDGEAYNISSGTSHSVTQLAHKLITVLGLEGRTQVEYTGKSWVGDAQRWEVSVDKITAIGYRPCYSLEEGLQQTIQWFEGIHGSLPK